MLPVDIKVPVLIATTIYQLVASWLEDRPPAPGQRVDVGGYALHLWVKGVKEEASPTIIVDHSLGGIDGYFLIEELSQLGQTCIYERAGYGWSDFSPHPRTSASIVAELDNLLTRADIRPPYLLIGNSFGSYNMRLYAHRFPEKVVGLVLTDGLHEAQMLNMPWGLQALKLFFLSGFIMSIFGSILGIIRLLSLAQAFELIKPQLRQFPQHILRPVKRSFLRPQHWLTMSLEILNLDRSAKQVSIAQGFGMMPVVNIKANYFFQPSFLSLLIPLKKADELREKMHVELLKLSGNCRQIQAAGSSHFVWVDRPDVIISAVRIIFNQLRDK